MDTGTNLTPSNTMDNSIGQVVPFNDPYQEPTDLITAQAGGGQEGQKTPDDVFSTDGKSIEERCEDCELPISYCDRLRGVRHAPREGGSGRYALDCDRCGEMYESCPECNGDICFDCHNDVCIFCGCNTLKYAAESFSAEQKKNECCERFTAWANGWGMTEEGKEKWNEWFVPKGDQSLRYQGIVACPFCGLHFHDKVRTRGAESFSAESKFKPPYEGRHGFNPKRDTKGRYRRKLVVPLKKDAESFSADSEGCSECLFQDEDDDREYIYGPMIYYYGGGGYRHIPNANYCYTCGAEIEKPQTGWAAESLVEEPDWIPAGDGRALGQQNLDINLSPLHAEGNLKDYNPITLVVLGIIGGIGIALGTQSLVK